MTEETEKRSHGGTGETGKKDHTGGTVMTGSMRLIGMTAYRATQSCFSRAATAVADGGVAAVIVIRRTRISTYEGSAHRG